MTAGTNKELIANFIAWSDIHTQGHTDKMLTIIALLPEHNC